MTSTAICDNVSSSWEINSAGQNACQMYAQVQAQCNSSFVMNGITPNSPPYYPPNNECGCNVVAYNLMAGCRYCQSTNGLLWVSVSDWAYQCTQQYYVPNAITPSVSAANVALPLWALAIPTGTWNVARASQIATTGNSIGPMASSFLNPEDPFRIIQLVREILVYTAVGVLLVSVLLGLFAHSRRQKRKKIWSRPTAYYHQLMRAAGGYYVQYPPIAHAEVTGSAVPLTQPMASPRTPEIYPQGSSPSAAADSDRVTIPPSDDVSVINLAGPSRFPGAYVATPSPSTPTAPSGHSMA